MRGSRSGGSPLLLLRGWTSPACGHTGRPSPDLTSFSSSFVSSFCTRLFRDEECLDRWGLSECSYSKVVVDSTFHSPKTLPKSLPTRQVLTLPSWSRSKEITALPAPQVPGPRLSPKIINSPRLSGSWGITRKAGPASALMMLQKHVPGEHSNSRHLLRERILSAWGRVEESLTSAYGRRRGPRSLTWTTARLREERECTTRNKQGNRGCFFFFGGGAGCGKGMGGVSRARQEGG